ncbi:PAS domain S-box protein [Nostoc sp. FACHB-152]|uniref:sensor histidine kinase n=1 Tax=unclassified Nostoc TaxID=2593658 RepID=UPI001683DAD2|nr:MULTISPECIES: PAS domain S-box protein [unclassified Nostoc]MBD2447753.1 PAS domain S-box protein [Nostoc sp. FACHB-152]MBD2467044.1 PAS domain S-box protein [Nostoc sp. FACHB-145]
MNKLSQKIVVYGFTLALCLLSGVGIASFISFSRLKAEKQWLIHTHQVIEALENARLSLTNAKSARSSYILTKKAVYKEVYQQERQKVNQQIKTIRNLTIDNLYQQKQIDKLEPLMAQKFNLLQESIQIFEQQSLDKVTPFVSNDEVIAVGEQVYGIFQAMEIEEVNLLRQRTLITDTSFRNMIVLVGLGYGLSLLLIVVVYWLLQKQIRINKALAEEAIRMEQQATQAQLTNILETVTDAFVALDNNWCYTYVNQRAGQLFNRRSEDLIGKNIWEEFSEIRGKKFYDACYKAVAEKQPIEIEEYYPLWDRWLENHIYPSKEGLSIFFQDITRRKLAEIALEKSETRYRSLVIATSQAVWIADANGLPKEFSLWSALTGQTQAEVEGGGWLNAIHPDDRELSQLLWNHASASKSPYKLEHRVRVADGSYRFFSVYAVPILDSQNEILEWIGTHTDITERKLAEEALHQTKAELEIKIQERTAELQKINEELKRSNQELEQFAYVASHDLQEPLRAVTGYSQLLMEEYREVLDESAKEYIDYIIDGAKRMQQLIQDLLAYSRVGTRGREFTLIDCHTVLNEALSNLSVAIAQSQVIITHDSLPTLLADKTQLVQLFQNLIGNAIKFHRKNVPPRIHVSAVRAEEVGERGSGGAEEQSCEISPLHPCIPAPLHSSHPVWLFSVQDNGIGIKTQYLERIFEVFRRLHTRREFPGTGIGLAICKKIVERHHGHIWAESQLGIGTTFYFTLQENSVT